MGVDVMDQEWRVDFLCFPQLAIRPPPVENAASGMVRRSAFQPLAAFDTKNDAEFVL